ncbi:MAG: AMP-binding protein [Burkholderiaceae bacterium]
MPNLAAFLAAHEDEPQRAVFREMAGDRSQRTSLGELADQAARWQTAFLAAGLEHGDRVAISARNSLQWLAIDLAALGLGLVTVPLDPQASARFAAAAIAHSGANLLLIDSAGRASQIRAAGPPIARVVVLRKLQHGRARLTSLEDFLPETAKAAFQVAELEEDTLATLSYQRVGQDGIRGLMLTHNNLLAAVHAQQAANLLSEDEVVLAGGAYSELFHRVTGLYLPLACSAQIACPSAGMDLEQALQQLKPDVLLTRQDQLQRVAALARAPLEAEGAGLIPLTTALNAGWQVAQGSAGWVDRTLHGMQSARLAQALHQTTGGHLKRIISAEPGTPAQVVRQLSAQGLAVLTAFSLAAASGLVSVNTPEEIHDESCGLPLPGLEAQISDSGELLLRGLTLALGYWNDPASTERDFEAEGWLHTGHRARLADGHIMIEGFLAGVAPQDTQQVPVVQDLSMTHSTLPG